MYEAIEQQRRAIADKVARVKRSAELANQALSRAERVFETLSQEAARLILDGTAEIDVSAYASDWSESGIATVTLTLKDQESWHAATPFIEALEQWEFPVDGWKSTDDAKEFARTFEQGIYGPASEGEGKPYVCAGITVMLKEGNTGGCRRVYVGKKISSHTSEVEEYKLVCEEEKPDGRESTEAARE